MYETVEGVVTAAATLPRFPEPSIDAIVAGDFLAGSDVSASDPVLYTVDGLGVGVEVAAAVGVLERSQANDPAGADIVVVEVLPKLIGADGVLGNCVSVIERNDLLTLAKSLRAKIPIPWMWDGASKTRPSFLCIRLPTPAQLASQRRP
ncbi:MAG: hypothetical protein DLM70_03380, partial [Chloroflexi bacterium]